MEKMLSEKSGYILPISKLVNFWKKRFKSSLVALLLDFDNSLRARDGFIQPIFYKMFDCFSL